MADTTTTAVKTDAKTEAPTKAKDAPATDTGSSTESSTETVSPASDAPAGYSRGENQKLVTDSYRSNWDNIFGRKASPPSEDVKSTPPAKRSSQDLRINYIELNVGDIARSKAFYGKAFGWTFTDYGPDYCGFSDGHMNGGFDATGTVAPGGPLVVLRAVDLADAQERVEAAGGAIVKPIFEFPGGRRFHFTDPDGYELAVWSET